MGDSVNFHILECTVSKAVTIEGSVRVDLLGGTLDLVPINLILPNVVTLNLATSLKAKVTISPIDFDEPKHKPRPHGHAIAARITSENPDEVSFEKQKRKHLF